MDTLTALAITTSAVSIIVAIVTWQQWVTNRARLKHELFDRRFKIYQRIVRFISDILKNGDVPVGGDAKFVRQTALAFFAFDCDTGIKSLIHSVYECAVNLHAVNADLVGATGDERSTNIKRQQEIKDSLQLLLISTDLIFAKYLRLEH